MIDMSSFALDAVPNPPLPDSFFRSSSCFTTYLGASTFSTIAFKLCLISYTVLWVGVVVASKMASALAIVGMEGHSPPARGQLVNSPAAMRRSGSPDIDGAARQRRAVR